MEILAHKLGEVFYELLALSRAVLKARPQDKSLRRWVSKVPQALDAHGAI